MRWPIDYVPTLRGSYPPGPPKHVLLKVADEIELLRVLLERVLAANIAQGCKPAHPRIVLVYDIQKALEFTNKELIE